MHGVSKRKVVVAAIATFGWPDVMTTALACTYTARSRWTLYRAVAAGELVAAGRRGRTFTFRKTDLDAWLLGNAGNNENPTATAVAPTASRSNASGSATSSALERLATLRRGVPN